MAKVHAFSAGLALLAMGTSLSAQSTLAPGPFQQRDNRVNVGIVVPLGNAGSAAEQAPRLEAWSEAGWQRDRAQVRLRTDLDQGQVQSPRLGIALARQPRLMLNGRELPAQDDRKGVSTLGWVGIGVAVVVVVGGVALYSYANREFD